MANLFIFAIGGTGARVLSSLGILLASGLKVKADRIIPIIIDTDSQNFDTNRAIKILNNYRDIRKDISNLQNSFFHNTIYSLSDLSRQKDQSALNDSFLLQLQDTANKSFSDYINYSFIQDFETKSLLNLLYSQQNLDDPLTYGFLGSPNVGCVVLDSINQSNEFKNFGNLFQPGDRIFIISSIFGGTGAAGFPLLLNNFNQNNPNLANANALQNATIGAVSVLPYFTLTKNIDSRIDSSSFYTKSIAALSYYEENVRRVNSLYYIGDVSKTSAYDNVEGGNAQKNDVNFTELAAALAIYDFMEMPDEHLVDRSIYKEFALETDLEKPTLSDLGQKTRNILSESLTSLKLFNLFRSDVENQVGSAFTINNQIDKDFFGSNFYSNLTVFFEEHFSNWLAELQRNVRGFIPFSQVRTNDLSNLITGRQIDKNFFGQSRVSKKHFINICAKIKSDKGNSREKFIDLMHKASIKLYRQKITNLIN